jgi:hypothetical protein
LATIEDAIHALENDDPSLALYLLRELKEFPPAVALCVQVIQSESHPKYLQLRFNAATETDAIRLYVGAIMPIIGTEIQTKGIMMFHGEDTPSSQWQKGEIQNIFRSAEGKKEVVTISLNPDHWANWPETFERKANDPCPNCSLPLIETKNQEVICLNCSQMSDPLHLNDTNPEQNE